MLALPHSLRAAPARRGQPAAAARGLLACRTHALGAVSFLLAAALDLVRLGQAGYGNLYYAATVRSMLSGWHALFYAAFDPGGFVSVDKPPLGFWLQAASARLLGFSALSLLLPQALAGVLAVAVLYTLVGRAYGLLAGGLAALFLALTPISVATNRNNTIDSLLVLAVLLAAGALGRAVERGQLRWLLLAAGTLGLGFNIKMLQALLVLPAFWLAYLVAAPGSWRRRIAHLACASGVLGAVALVWAVAVDLTPAAARPYVGSTAHNSVLELIVWHNGLSRVLPGQPLFPGAGPADAMAGGLAADRPAARSPVASGAPEAAAAAFAGPGGIGAPGPLRLLARPLGGQIGWLLPLAALSLLLLVGLAWRGHLTLRQRQALWLWGGWLLTVVGFFSATRQFQPYYLVMLSPAVAAVAAIGLATLWQAYRGRAWLGWLLPPLLLAGVLAEGRLLADYPEWSAWLAPPSAALSLGSAAALLVARRRAWRHGRWARLAAGALGGGVLALLLAPGVWAALPGWHGDSPRPIAGPEVLRQPGWASAPAAARLIEFLTQHRDGARFLVATLNANTAAPLILATGAPVMAVGGFSGSDPILTPEQFAAHIAAGAVRYALFPAPTEPAGGPWAFGPARQQALVEWAYTHCMSVPREQWEDVAPADGPARLPGRRVGGVGGALTLLDCGAAASP
jgi:4-amino-4-deoxy-L-arabinose transferase-like glycosyltransferase